MIRNIKNILEVNTEPCFDDLDYFYYACNIRDTKTLKVLYYNADINQLSDDEIIAMYEDQHGCLY